MYPIYISPLKMIRHEFYRACFERFLNKHPRRFKLFVDCLEFKIGRDELNLFENTALAKEHNPEFRLVTDNIEEAYVKISSSHTSFLHPKLDKITLRPWGAKEFALTDGQLGIVIQQW